MVNEGTTGSNAGEEKQEGIEDLSVKDLARDEVTLEYWLSTHPKTVRDMFCFNSPDDPINSVKQLRLWYIFMRSELLCGIPKIEENRGLISSFLKDASSSNGDGSEPAKFRYSQVYNLFLLRLFSLIENISEDDAFQAIMRKVFSYYVHTSGYNDFMQTFLEQYYARAETSVGFLTGLRNGVVHGFWGILQIGSPATVPDRPSKLSTEFSQFPPKVVLLKITEDMCRIYSFTCLLAANNFNGKGQDRIARLLGSDEFQNVRNLNALLEDKERDIAFNEVFDSLGNLAPIIKNIIVDKDFLKSRIWALFLRTLENSLTDLLCGYLDDPSSLLNCDSLIAIYAYFNAIQQIRKVVDKDLENIYYTIKMIGTTESCDDESQRHDSEEKRPELDENETLKKNLESIEKIVEEVKLIYDTQRPSFVIGKILLLRKVLDEKKLAAPEKFHKSLKGYLTRNCVQREDTELFKLLLTEKMTELGCFTGKKEREQALQWLVWSRTGDVIDLILCDDKGAFNAKVSAMAKFIPAMDYCRSVITKRQNRLASDELLKDFSSTDNPVIVGTRYLVQSCNKINYCQRIFLLGVGGYFGLKHEFKDSALQTFLNKLDKSRDTQELIGILKSTYPQQCFGDLLMKEKPYRKMDRALRSYY